MKNILHLTLLGLIICSFNVNGQVSQSSLTFDGTNDYVDITTYQNMSPTSAVTVEAWINGGIPSSTAFIYDRVEQNDGFGLTGKSVV